MTDERRKAVSKALWEKAAAAGHVYDETESIDFVADVAVTALDEYDRKNHAWAKNDDSSTPIHAYIDYS